MSASAAALARLEDLLREALGAVRLLGPAELPELDPQARAVVVHPVALSRHGRSQRPGSRLDLLLTTLVVPTGPRALADLETVLVALDGARGTACEPVPPGLDLLRALGLPPSPGVLVVADVSVPEVQRPARLVEQPLRADIGPLRLLRGRVVGPSGAGIPFATVRAAEAEGSVRCAGDGAFRLPVAGRRALVTLVAEVKGLEFATEVPVDDGAPVVLRCDLAARTAHHVPGGTRSEREEAAPWR